MIWQHLKASVLHLWQRLWAFCARPGIPSLALALLLLNLALGWLSVLIFAPDAVALEQALFILAIAIGGVFAFTLILVLAQYRHLRWHRGQDGFIDIARRLAIVVGLLLWAGLLSLSVLLLGLYSCLWQVAVWVLLAAASLLLVVQGVILWSRRYAKKHALPLAEKDQLPPQQPFLLADDWLADTWRSLLTQKEHDFYTWHLHWRWQVSAQVLRMRWRRWRQAFSLWHWLAQLRALWVLLAAAVSLYLLLWIQHGTLVWDNPLLALHSLFFPGGDAPESRSYTLLLGSLVSAPVLFLLWKFRDTNQLWQLENSRKDINLKDFQQLARWAAGEHLPEISVEYASPKSGESALSNTQGLLDLPAEARTPIHKLSHSLPPQRPAAQGSLPSWRAGAESLQVAAVYQLDAFLAGEYGRHFQRPAFQLLCQLWRSVNESRVTAALQAADQQLQGLIQDMLEGESEDPAASDLRENVFELYTALAAQSRQSLDSALGQALHAVLWAQAGQRLRAHAPELAGTYWAGLDSRHAVLSQPAELDGLPLAGSCWVGANLSQAQLQGADLSQAQLQGADLRQAQLQGADLRQAQLQGAYLRQAQLQGADLRQAQLQGADLRGAQLQGADLSWAKLQGAVLRYARLQGADLSFAQLQGADLREAQLQGAYLRGAQLEGADLRNIALDDKTQFKGCTMDAATQTGIWLDDAGKIARPLEMATARRDEALSAALLQQMRAQGFPRLEPDAHEPDASNPQIQADPPDA